MPLWSVVGECQVSEWALASLVIMRLSRESRKEKQLVISGSSIVYEEFGSRGGM